MTCSWEVCGLFLACLVLPALASEKQYEFSVAEHSKAGETVGVFSDASMREFTSCEFMSTEAANDKYVRAFDCDLKDKRLVTSESARDLLDREELCRLNEECRIQLLLIVNKSKPLHVQVTLDDINDNPPQFAATQQDITFLENDKTLSKPLQLARDPDRSPGSDRNIRYQLMNLPRNSPFQLHGDEPVLHLSRALDYEEEQSYRLTLRACDDAPVNKSCTSQELLVNVTNVNDNRPIFPESVVQTNIEEVDPVHKTVVWQQATDRDLAEYGRLKYWIDPVSIEPKTTLDYFAIDPSTGQVRLMRSLADCTADCWKYSMKVCAADGYREDWTEFKSMDSVRHTACYQLVVNVLDTNNNRPVISLDASGSLVKFKHLHELLPSTSLGKVIFVAEHNETAQSSIAMLNVMDRDRGLNAKVNCNLYEESRLFQLNYKQNVTTSNQGTIWVYRLEAAGLDAEDLQQRGMFVPWENKYRVLQRNGVAGLLPVRIHCKDSGQPAQTSTELFHIGLVDRDEFPKSFARSLYEARVPENDTLDGHVILKLEVQDWDAAPRNHFEIVQDSSVNNLNLTRFTLDAGTGELRLREPLDFEQWPEHNLTIVARERDNSWSMMAETLVRVRVIDANDNDPQFADSLVDLKNNSQNLAENALYVSCVLKSVYLQEEKEYQAQPLLQLLASDRDSGQNGLVRFSLVSYHKEMQPAVKWPEQPVPRGELLKHQRFQQEFNVSAQGQVTFTGQLDRESASRYNLVVQVSDAGRQPRITRALLPVVVQDVNDWPPFWSFPTKGDNSKTLNSYQPVNEIITRFAAVDFDEPGHINSQLKFHLVNVTMIRNDSTQVAMFGRTGQPFKVNDITGELMLVSSLHEYPVGTSFQLGLRVCDKAEAPEMPKCNFQDEQFRLVITSADAKVRKPTGGLIASSLGQWPVKHPYLLTLACGVLLGLLLTVFVIVSMLVMMCRKRKSPRPPGPSKKQPQSNSVMSNFVSSQPMTGHRLGQPMEPLLLNPSTKMVLSSASSGPGSIVNGDALLQQQQQQQQVFYWRYSDMPAFESGPNSAAAGAVGAALDYACCPTPNMLLRPSDSFLSYPNGPTTPAVDESQQYHHQQQQQNNAILNTLTRHMTTTFVPQEYIYIPFDPNATATLRAGAGETVSPHGDMFTAAATMTPFFTVPANMDNNN